MYMGIILVVEKDSTFSFLSKYGLSVTKADDYGPTFILFGYSTFIIRHLTCAIYYVLGYRFKRC